MVKKFLSSSQKLKFLPFDIYLVFSEPHTTTSDKGDSSLIDCFYMYVKPSYESANYIKDNYCFVKSRLQMKKLWNVTCVSVELYDVAHFEEMWGRQFNVTSSSRAADQSSQFASNAFIASRQRVYSSFSTRGSRDAFHSRCAPKLYCNAFMAQGSPQGNVFTRALPL